MAADAHVGRGSGHGIQGNEEKTPAFLWEVRTCPWLLPAPRGTVFGGEACGGGAGDDVSGALPDTHSQGPPEVQVEEVLHLVCDLKAEAFADHHMPGGAELLVHGLFDHLGSALQREQARRGRAGGGQLGGESGRESAPSRGTQTSWPERGLVAS